MDFCKTAFRLADCINAVGEEHGIETVKMFKRLYGGDFDKEVIGILNGSGKTWKNDKLAELEKNGQAVDEQLLLIFTNRPKKIWRSGK